MAQGKRWLLAGLGGLAIGLGLGCLNYTNPATFEHHRIWASEHSMPPPGRTVQFAGAGAFIIGGALVALRLTAGRAPG